MQYKSEELLENKILSSVLLNQSGIKILYVFELPLYEIKDKIQEMHSQTNMKINSPENNFKILGPLFSETELSATSLSVTHQLLKHKYSCSLKGIKPYRENMFEIYSTSVK